MPPDECVLIKQHDKHALSGMASNKASLICGSVRYREQYDIAPQNPPAGITKPGNDADMSVM